MPHIAPSPPPVVKFHQIQYFDPAWNYKESSRFFCR